MQINSSPNTRMPSKEYTIEVGKENIIIWPECDTAVYILTTQQFNINATLRYIHIHSVLENIKHCDTLARSCTDVDQV